MATVLAAAICASSARFSAVVNGTCSTAPRAPCSDAATSAGVLAAEPPAPAPTCPGDAGVGAASSHGDLPVALPGMTFTEFADTIASVGAVVVDGAGGATVVV